VDDDAACITHLYHLHNDYQLAKNPGKLNPYFPDRHKIKKYHMYNEIMQSLSEEAERSTGLEWKPLGLENTPDKFRAAQMEFALRAFRFIVDALRNHSWRNNF